MDRREHDRDDERDYVAASLELAARRHGAESFRAENDLRATAELPAIVEDER